MRAVSLMGVNVHATDLRGAFEAIESIISESRKSYICLAPAHNLMACRSDATLRQIFNRSTLTLPDGMGTVWFLKLLGHQARRVYGPDLMMAACSHGQVSNWRHFFLGGTPEVAAILVKRLQADFPSLQSAGVFSPPFRKMQENEVTIMVNQINKSQADIVWVGLGSPKQEYWMAEFRERLEAPVLIGVGAAFDFLAGAKPQAPRLIQKLGFEWLFRLMMEPRRLWRRYATYPLFVLLAAAQILGLARYSVEEPQ